MRLSVAIATFNEQKKLGRCLDAVSSWVDEIVLVDGGSTDKTLEVARLYKARIIKTDNPSMFHINKQKALDACRGEWILQLDADEVVTEELKDEILGVVSDKRKTVNGYYLPRKNFFCNRWLRKGGQYPNLLLRLVRRGKAHFPCKSVHEQISVEGRVGYLCAPLLHFAYDSVGEYWRKANTYIDAAARDMQRRAVPKNLLSWVTYTAIKPTSTFFLIFFRHKGFLDGFWGFVFAVFSALHHPLAYVRYVKNRR